MLLASLIPTTFADLIKLGQSAAAGYALFGTLWTFIFAFASRAAGLKARRERDRVANEAQASLDSKRKEERELSDRVNKVREDERSDIERRNRALASIARELRKLLKDSMTSFDRLDKWTSILEAAIEKYEPSLLSKRPEYNDKPTADDVAAIYAEHGNDASEESAQ